MIKTTRPVPIPNVLLEAGTRQKDIICREYDRSPEDYRSGRQTITFNHKIYGHESVKRVLAEAQHGKCCYCERKFGATSYGAVEHFRPKGAVRQNKGSVKLVPGYYWLAFDWNNLLVSCEKCNTSYKGSLFPLEDPNARARSHMDDVRVERPLFVDPSRENPREHIRFRSAAVEPATPRGRETIAGVGLRRSELEEARKERLDMVELMQEIVGMENGIEQRKLEKAKEKLAFYSSVQSEFSAMVQDFLESTDTG